MTEHAFRLGDWLVTPARHALERDGEVIRLKPKAMAVLEQLAGAAGDVVPRDELFAAVWPGCAVTDDTLTQCVVELRRALGDSARAPRFIETVPRRGFRLLADVQVTEAAVARHVVRRRWPVLAALVALAAVALTTLATMPRSAAPSAQSLAVLPFADLSPSEDYGFFADGLTEELINRLSMLDGLQVTGRTSAFQFRGGVDDLGDVRERLGVTWVLDGSVRRDRGRLRVSAQLIDTATGYPAWLETYEENSTGIFEIQDGIAEAVAGALSVRLGVGHLGREPGGTRNLDAYEAHIQGNALYAEFTAEAMRQAAAYYERAIELDPGYAWAWATMADMYRNLWLVLPASEAAPYQDLSDRAMAAAIELAPASSVVRRTQAFHLVDRGDYLGAEAALAQVQELDGLVSTKASSAYVSLLIKTGKAREVEPIVALGRRREPLSAGAAMYLGHVYAMQGRVEEALDELERGYAADLKRGLISVEGLVTSLATRDDDVVARWLERAVDYQPPGAMGIHTAMAARLRDPDEALRFLRRGFAERAVPDYYVILWAAYYGDEDLALDALRRYPDPWALWAPVLAEVRRSPAFAGIVESTTLPLYWERHGWGDFCERGTDRVLTCY